MINSSEVTDERSAPTATSSRSSWVGWCVGLLCAVAALAYWLGSANGSLEPYYEAAVRSMGSNWHDFIFGSFDPAGTISVDKLPGALWIQALSVRALGFSTWSILLPQLLEAIPTILMLFHAVSRLAGNAAGIAAATTAALAPAVVALDRGNISDTLLLLFLVAAADATVTAIGTRHSRWLVLAGALIGLGFQAKMLEAWLLVPVVGLVWLVAGAGKLARRIGEVLLASVVALVVSISWMAAVSLVPASSRPYVDGSPNDSLFHQVFIYNGFGRVGSTSWSAGLYARAFRSLANFGLPGGAGPSRLLIGAGGRDIGWLLPMSLVALVWGILERRGRPRSDIPRAGLLLFGGWLLLFSAAFSLLSGLNAYYLAALAPAIGGVLAVAGALAWQHRAERPLRRWVVALSALTIVYGVSITWPVARIWAIAVGCLSLVVLLLGWIGTRQLAHSGVGTNGARSSFKIAFVATSCLALATVLPMSVATVDIVARGLGPFDTPFESAAVADATQVVPKEALVNSQSGAQVLLAANRDRRFVAATYTSLIAAPLIIDTGREFEPIGGFTGTIPSPTTAALASQIRRGELQTVLAPQVRDPRVAWVQAHCIKVTTTHQASNPITGLRAYFCPR